MADLEEVLSEMDSTDYIHDSIQFIIDKNLRTIPVPSNGSVLGVTGDNNVNRVNFKMERYYDGNDLSEFTIRISYKNATGYSNFYDVTDNVIEGDYILFTWLVSSDVVANAGTVHFAVRLFVMDNTDPTKIVKSFNTSIVTANVIQGMYVSDGMSQEDQHDIITQLLSMIEIPEAGGGVGQNTEGKELVIGGTTYAGSANSEIFNDYENNIATNSYSHAEGTSTAALAYASHAEGEKTIASGSYAHAEGWETTASGSYSHAEGQSARATNTCAHAEGNASVASGYASHAEGENCTASEQNAHAEGYYTTASGRAAHAEGYYAKATNNYGHAEGYKTESKGCASHAEGYRTIAANVEGQHAMGKFNVEDTSGKYAFIIGNGEDTSNRSNAFAIDWDGKIYVGDATEGVDVSALGGSGGVGQNTEGMTFSNVIINGSTATYYGNDTAEIFNSYANNVAAGSYSHAEGSATRAISIASHSEGGETTASGNYSHAEGQATYATGDSSHAEGMSTKATNINAHAEGNATTASGKNAHAEGMSATASGNVSHAEGYDTIASGYISHAEGKWSTASAECSHAEGTSTKASSANQHVQGKYNVEDTENKYAFIIGNGNDRVHSNAFAIDWDGKIYVNNATEGVDVAALLGRVAELEAKVAALEGSTS